MKFVHISDLHIGKRLNEYSLIEDQKFILREILNIIDEEKPVGVLIAGDVYDKSVPSAEAVTVLDEFLTSLAKKGVQTFLISGNHDSPERLAFGSRLMEQSGIHIARTYDGNIEPISLKDGQEEVYIYMLPFIKPANVRRYFDEEIDSYNDAVRVAVSKMNIDSTKNNILITHQFVTGAVRSESEEISVGGTDNVDASNFDCFDYVALGHIHSPQNCSSPRVRYCGTPLKYSFSEANDEKSVTVVEICSKCVDIRSVPLKPLHDMVEIKGKYDDIMKKSFYEGTTYSTDYTHITLTDENDVLDAIGKLRTVYHNLMRLDYDNKRTRGASKIDNVENIEAKTPLELFEEFFELQNNQKITEIQREFVNELIEKIWEGEK